MIYLLVVSLSLLSQLQTCSLNKKIVCKDEVIEERSEENATILWDADPALQYDYHYSHSKEGLWIRLKAKWRVLQYESFEEPIHGFELSLVDLDDGLLEVRNNIIIEPASGIRKLDESASFTTTFNTSLEFGHQYKIELRFIPVGSSPPFVRLFSIPTLPSSNECQKDSAIASEKDRYMIQYDQVRKYPITATTSVSFFAAPKAFCFTEYTLEVFETDNPQVVYGKVMIASPDFTSLVKHDFPNLPTGVYLSVKVYPTETPFATFNECVCANCNCLATQTKKFMFASKEIRSVPPASVSLPVIEHSQIPSYFIVLFLLIPLMLVLIILITVIFLKAFNVTPASNVNLIPDWRRREKESILTTCSSLGNHDTIWLIGPNTDKELSFLSLISSELSSSTRLVFGPRDLSDGENVWQWISRINREADVILLLLSNESLDLYHLQDKSLIMDSFDVLFIESITGLHPSDHRIITVALDDCQPVLFKTNEIVFRNPRDLPILRQSLEMRGFKPADPSEDPLLPIPVGILRDPSLSFVSRGTSTSISAQFSEAEDLIEVVEHRKNTEESEDSGFISTSSLSQNLSQRFTALASR